MSIQSAIVATSPLHYYTLGDAVGSVTAPNLGSAGGSALYIGEAGLGITGPEIGTTALRMWGGTGFQSTGLGMTTWPDFTLMFALSHPANGSVGGQTLVAGVGNPSALNARGLSFSIQSGGVGQGTGWATLAGFANINAGQPFPQAFWQFVTVQFDNAGQNLLLRWGSNSPTTNHNFGATQPLVTDPLVILSNTPTALAHIATWPRLLTSTEITSITSQIPAWPYEIPAQIKVEAPTTTVDLTPVLTDTGQILDNQATLAPQVTDIQNTVHPTQTTVNTIHDQLTGLISVTFPDLATVLDGITNGITATLQGIGGTISRTIGDLFSGKLWELLSEYHLGSVCAPDTLDENIGGGTFFGVRLQCTSYAGWYVFTGPGDTYTTQSLGTLELFRGGALLLRTGLHTLTHEVYPLPGVPMFSLETEMPTIPGDYHILVYPAPETCWDVKLLQFP